MSPSSELESALRAHLEKTFPCQPITTLDVDPLGRLVPFAPDFRVLEVHPGPASKVWTYVTCGASQIRHLESEPLEFLTVSSERSERVALLLTMAAYYHATQTLGLHHVFGLGEAWVEGSALTAGYISLPYPWGPALELFDYADRRVSIYWLMPISQAERELAVRAGADALEQRFEGAEVAYWDLRRRSVVTDPADKHVSRSPTIQGRRIVGGCAALLVVSLILLGGYWVSLTREATAHAARIAGIEARDDEARARWSTVAADHEVVTTEHDLLACTPGAGLSTEPWRGTYGGSEDNPTVTIAEGRITIHDPTTGFAGAFCLVRPLASGPARFRAVHFTSVTQGMSVAFLEITTSHGGLTLSIVPLDNPTDDTHIGPLRRHEAARAD